MEANHFELLVPGRPESVRNARKNLRDVTQRWGCSDIEGAQLVLSELLTNAITHAHSSVVCVSVDRRPDHVHIAVADDSSAEPIMRTSSAGGFGLHIVEKLANRWGWGRTQEGKI